MSLSEESEDVSDSVVSPEVVSSLTGSKYSMSMLHELMIVFSALCNDLVLRCIVFGGVFSAQVYFV
jgi:hypothetical protein